MIENLPNGNYKIITEFVTTYYDSNGSWHREDGPAKHFKNGGRVWYIHGVRHRLDGPARDFPPKTFEWFYKGERIICSSQKEFERLIKLQVFL